MRVPSIGFDPVLEERLTRHLLDSCQEAFGDMIPPHNRLGG
jgi:hypothetical protein